MTKLILWSFPEAARHAISQRLNEVVDTRISRSPVKPDIEEPATIENNATLLIFFIWKISLFFIKCMSTWNEFIVVRLNPGFSALALVAF